VHGGFQSPLILGSRSGLAPLTAGMEFTCLPGVAPTRFLHTSFRWNEKPNVLRITDGLQADWFDSDSFIGQEYHVSPTSNRMGLRLQGRALSFPPRELLSEPVSPGAVQVTRDGQCIILGVDGQTIGGYPKIAQVISADVDKLGQLRPGAEIFFVRIDLQQAAALYWKKEAEVNEWMARLKVWLEG